MTPTTVRRRIVVDRLAIVDALLGDIRALPLENMDALAADRRNLWSIESCVRRALEALFDIGRHILARGFARGVSEYREIAQGLEAVGVLDADEAALLAKLAGYRNRMVHLYHDIGEDELYEIAQHRLPDLERIAGAYRRWMADHPERVDDSL